MNRLGKSLIGHCGLAIVLGSGLPGCLVKRAESAASPQPPAGEVWLTGRQVRDAQITQIRNPLAGVVEPEVRGQLEPVGGADLRSCARRMLDAAHATRLRIVMEWAVTSISAPAS